MYNSDTSHVSVFLQAKQGNAGTDWCILVLRPACWPPLKLVSIGVVCYLCHNICANMTAQKNNSAQMTHALFARVMETSRVAVPN